MQQRRVVARPRRHTRPGAALLSFDSDTLARLDQAKEVVIETTRPNGTTKRRRIWVVVSDGDVLVRSVRGDRGYWYQCALDRPDGITLHVAKQQIAVRAIPAADAASIERCSTALRDKYAADPALPSMLRDHTQETTLRLEPR